MDNTAPYRVTVKVRNNNILRAIAAVGGAPGQKWCSANGLPYLSVNDLVNLTASPVNSNGELRNVAVKLCEVTNTIPDDLWTHEQLFPLERNISEVDMDSDQVRTLLTHSMPTDPLELAEHRVDVTRLLGQLGKVQPRGAKVLHMRFHEDLTLEEVANKMGVQSERVRQIEQKALRELRKLTRSAHG